MNVPQAHLNSFRDKDPETESVAEGDVEHFSVISQRLFSPENAVKRRRKWDLSKLKGTRQSANVGGIIELR
jgi:hypothetical protein